MAAKDPTQKMAQIKRKGGVGQSNPPLSQQGEEMLYLVARYGYVSTPQIANRLFNGNKQSSQMADINKKLFDSGYIDRFPLPSTSPARNMPLVATLTKKGAELVANIRNLALANLYVPSATDQPKAAYFEHLMMINDVRVMIELACEHHSFELKWLDERTIRKHKLYEEIVIQIHPGKTEKTANIPDGFFSIKTQAGWLNFFLEIDRGTEAHVVIHKKAQVYLAYEKTGHYAQYYSASDTSGITASLFALLVTNAAKRRDAIVTSLGKALPSQPFLCSAYPELTQENVLTESIWYAPHLTDAVALVSP